MNAPVESVSGRSQPLSLPDPHTLPDLTRLLEQHEGPVTGVTVDLSCTAVAGDLRCVLPPGHYAHHRAAFRGHSITWPADDTPFGTETDPS